jgi:signal transduction histidine kinase
MDRLARRQETAEAERSRLLLELSREVTANLKLQEVLDASFAALRQLLDFGGGAIQLIDGDALVAAATDPPATPEALTVRIPIGQGVSGTIAATGEPCYIPDITVDPRVYPAGRAKGVSGGVRAYFGVPLILQGRPIGVVQLDSPDIDAFDDATRGLVLSFVPTIAAAVQNARLFEREATMLRDLRELQRLQSDFLAMVSHELRTPLTAISGMAETLVGRLDDLEPAVVVSFAERILRNSHRLELVIDDLLDLSQIEQGRLRVVREPTALGPLVQRDVEEADVGPHPIQLRIDPDLPLADTDGRRARQVLANLLSNAVKYSPPDAPITVSVRREPGWVVLEVVDEGEGVPPHLRSRIFEPFYQAEPAATRRAGGLGVGLHLVRELCLAMGATVSLHSASPQGSCFRVAFPTTRGEPAVHVVEGAG